MSDEDLERRDPAAPASYYGYPALKAPVWTWEVPAYFFVGGAAGAAAVIASVAQRSGGSPELVRTAKWIAAAGGTISPPLLISDLGRPERFLNMLRVFKLRSPMSVGAWTLVAFSNAAAASALADLAPRACRDRLPLRVIATGADLLAAGTGGVLATYTGVLLGATAIPVWSKNARLLPLHFGASGTGAAVSLLELLGHRDRALNAIGIGAAIVETTMGAHLELSGEPALRPMKEGAAGSLARLAGVLSGPLPLVIRLFAGRSRSARRIAAISTIAGSILTRTAWVSAGKSSATRPT